MANGLQQLDILGALQGGLGIRRQQQAVQQQQTLFQQQQEDRQRQIQQQQAQAQQEESAAREKQLFQDSRSLNQLVRSGNLDQAEQLIINRVQGIQARGGDPTQSLQVAQLFEQGRQTGDFSALHQVLDGGDLIAVNRGILEPIAPPKREAFQKGEQGLVFNPNDGTFAVDPVAKARFDQLAEKSEAQGGLGFKDRQALNKDVTGLVKNTVGIHNTARDLDKLGKVGTGPASIAIVFKFMKALDPTSVVREGEFATAENSAGIPESVSNIYNKLVSGERLGQAQINQFIEASKRLANSAVESSAVEVDSLLDTFEGTIPATFREKLAARIPKPFELAELPTPATPAAPTAPAAQQFTSQGGIQFTVDNQ